MKLATKLARDEIKGLKPCIHGGEVWEVTSKHDLLWKDISDFSANVNPLGPAQKALESVKNSLWQIPFYPDSNSTTLKEAIAEYFKRNDHATSPDNVVVGNGSTELIYLFADVFIKKGDEALIPVPTFGEYENAVRKAGGKPKHIKLAQDFSIVITDLLDEITSATKIIFLCNPNNPTSILTPLEKLREIIEKASKENILVLLDEDFMEFVDEEKRFSLIGKVKYYPNLFVLRSFTKVFGLTGLRVGYGIACKEIINLLLKAKIPWNVNCLAQAAAIAALKDEGYLRETWRLVKRERGFLLNELKQIKGFKVFPADANFIFVDIRQSGFTAAQLKETMLRHGILIRDCSSFRGLDKYYIRVAIRTRQENERLLKALKEIVGVGELIRPVKDRITSVSSEHTTLRVSYVHKCFYNPTSHDSHLQV
jgi:L-threonine-O-3-phosphate decarboxylase